MLRIIITKAISLDYYNLVLHIYSQEETGKTVTGSSKYCVTSHSLAQFISPFIILNKNEPKGLNLISEALKGLGLRFLGKAGN